MVEEFINILQVSAMTCFFSVSIIEVSFTFTGLIDIVKLGSRSFSSEL